MNPRQEHVEHLGIPERIRVVPQARVEDAPFAVLTNPGDRVVIVVAEALAEASPLRHVGRQRIDAQQDPHLVARIRRREAVELVDVLERLSVEGAR